MQRYIAEAEERYSGRNDGFDKIESLLLDEEPLNIPEDVRDQVDDVRLGLAQQFLDKIVQVLTSDAMTIKAPPPPDATVDDERLSERRSRWLRAAWSKLQKPVEGRIAFTQDVAQFGMGVLKFGLRRDVWQGEPSLRSMGIEELTDTSLSPRKLENVERLQRQWKLKAPLPMILTCPDPRTVYPTRGVDGTLDSVLELYEMPLRDVEHQLGLYGAQALSADDTKGAGHKIKVAEHWTPQTQTVMLQGRETWRIVTERLHNWGYVPYVIAEGKRRRTTDPAKRYVSVLESLRTLAPRMDRLVTSKAWKGGLSDFPMWQVITPSGEQWTPTETGEFPSFVLRPGRVVRLPPGTEAVIQPIAIPASTGETDDLIGILSHTMSLGQMDPAAYGGGRASSGYGQALQSLLARVPWKLLADSVADGIGQIMEWMLTAIERQLESEVPVLFMPGSDREHSGWVSIGPDDIQSYANVHVMIRPYDPLELMARRDHALKLKAGGFIPHLDALELAEFPEPQRMKDDLDWEEIERSPEVKAAKLSRALAQLGIIDPAETGTPQIGPEQLAAIQQILGSQGGAAPGTPSLPGVGAPAQGPANQPGPNQVQVA